MVDTVLTRSVSLFKPGDPPGWAFGKAKKDLFEHILRHPHHPPPPPTGWTEGVDACITTYLERIADTCITNVSS